MQADSIKTRVESACGVHNQRLKLQYDEPLSHFAINFNLRRYGMGGGQRPARANMGAAANMQEREPEPEIKLTLAQAREAGAYTRPLLSST